MEMIEGRLLDIEAKTEQTDKVQKKTHSSIEELKNIVRGQELRIKTNERDMNNVQQYSRRSKVQPLNSLQLLAEPVCFNERIKVGKKVISYNFISNGLCMVSDALVILLLKMENFCHMHNSIENSI